MRTIRGRRPDSGVTLVEVLVAILVQGVGLLALLTLFPLGVLEMAQAVKDDRTAAVAANAEALSEVGRDLLSRTKAFVIDSLSNGAVDPGVVAQLQQEYEDLTGQVADLELELQELQSLFPRPQIQRHLARLLAQIRSIKLRLDTLGRLLALVGNDVK
jgi:Tfp pilus assembly protein PilV